jgi:hypothetical protein
MNKEELIKFIKDNLKIKIINCGTPTTFGGECEGNYAVKVELWLENPITGKLEQIHSDQTALSY